MFIAVVLSLLGVRFFAIFLNAILEGIIKQHSLQKLERSLDFLNKADMKYFPAFIDLTGKRTLVAGSGADARVDPLVQKIRLFLTAGALVDVVFDDDRGDGACVIDLLAPEFDDAAQRIRVVPFSQFTDEIASYRLVVAASGEDVFDGRVRAVAQAAGRLVNVVDQQDLCDYITPAIVDRGDVVVGISSSGTSPVLVRRIREQIERLLPIKLGALARFAKEMRPSVAARVPGPKRRLFWERFFDSRLADQALTDGLAPGREDFLDFVDRFEDQSVAGRVFIVGAGPGDPELLTLKALRVMQQADVVFYDKLVGPEILNLVRRDAVRVFVGKSRACHTMAQDEINRRMAGEAKAGRIVVRLKGGDPFVFGRGGEELDHLRAEGIACEVVPGITAALGSAASVQMPLTHRDHSQAVTFVTGHGKAGADNIDWASLAQIKHTLVFYMGVARAGQISAGLSDGGVARTTPVAVVENATLPNQRVVRGELWELQALVDQHRVTGPALIVVGAVARLGSAEIVGLWERRSANDVVPGGGATGEISRKIA